MDSTAIYEGLRFGLDTYILDGTGAVQMEYLLSNSHATLVQSAQEYLTVRAAEDHNSTMDSEFFFSHDSTERFQRAVDMIRN